MKHITELDAAQLRLEFRRLYKEIGFKGMTQVLYELIISSQLCAEVMKEEYEKERV